MPADDAAPCRARADASQVDVLCAGLAFLDANFAALPLTGPVLGQELWTDRWSLVPGGVANFALAVAQLGGRAALVCACGDDEAGHLFVSESERFGIDCSSAQIQPGWRQPVTAALSWGGDRALVTGGTPPPVVLDSLLDSTPVQAPMAVAHLEREPINWVRRSADAGVRVIGQIGWDATPDTASTTAWDLGRLIDSAAGCWALMPNEDEALAYTGARDVERAAARLADHVPVVAITRGSAGVLMLDASSGHRHDIAALPVQPVDSTGAGDVFAAAFALATARGAGVRASAVFANAVAALTVSRPGGATSTPHATEALALIAEHHDHAAVDELGGALLAPSTPSTRSFGTLPATTAPTHH